MVQRVPKRNLRTGFIAENNGTMRIIQRLTSPSGRVRTVSRRCGKGCNNVNTNKILPGTYTKRKTANYYPPTKCSMKKVSGAKTKTGRKCVGNGRSTENQIAARRAYNRAFRGVKTKSPPKKKTASPPKKKTASPPLRRGGRVRKERDFYGNFVRY